MAILILDVIMCPAMVELWFKYGKTEIFTEVDGPLEILHPPQKWSATEQLKQQISSLAVDTTRRLVVDYVHSVEGFEHVIKSAVEALTQKAVNNDEMEAMVTCWRYNDQQVEISLFNHAKSLLKDLGIVKIEYVRELGGVDLSESLVITPTVYWDCKAVGSLDFCPDCRGALVVTPVVGSGGIVSDVLVGSFDEIMAHSSEKIETFARYTPANSAEILLMGGPGYPVDSRLSTCINIASSVFDVQPGKVIVFMLECSEGLGEDEFVSLLIGSSSNEGQKTKILEKRLTVWRKVVENHKVCLVTALPSTIVNKLLNARQMDTLDQALNYGWRLKSKEATVLAVPNSVGTFLTGF